MGDSEEDSQGEVGSKQLAGSTANQGTKGGHSAVFAVIATQNDILLLPKCGSLSRVLWPCMMTSHVQPLSESVVATASNLERLALCVIMQSLCCPVCLRMLKASWAGS